MFLKFAAERIRRISRRVLGLDQLYSQLQGSLEKHMEDSALRIGSLAAHHVQTMPAIRDFRDVEFSVFSQFGDDGIIQYLIHTANIKNNTFIEFGVANYLESNTRFLMMNNNWSGFVMDCSEANIKSIYASPWFWLYDLRAETAFVTCENINNLLEGRFADNQIGLLHIDIDGNDYWIWEKIECINPTIVIIEYNSVFGSERAITIPYNTSFNRTIAHHSNLYWGASLPAFAHLANKRGYALVGCNGAGNNAFFLKRDCLGGLRERSVKEAFVASQYRESRDENGKLNFIRGDERQKLISGMPVINVLTGCQENL